jgi:hypothetical protein
MNFFDQVASHLSFYVYQRYRETLWYIRVSHFGTSILCQELNDIPEYTYEIPLVLVDSVLHCGYGPVLLKLTEYVLDPDPIIIRLILLSTECALHILGGSLDSIRDRVRQCERTRQLVVRYRVQQRLRKWIQWMKREDVVQWMYRPESRLVKYAKRRLLESFVKPS